MASNTPLKLCCMQIAGGIPVMDMDLIQMERRNKLGCHILENPNKMAEAGKQSTSGLANH